MPHKHAISPFRCHCTPNLFITPISRSTSESNPFNIPPSVISRPSILSLGHIRHSPSLIPVDPTALVIDPGLDNIVFVVESLHLLVQKGHCVFSVAKCERNVGNPCVASAASGCFVLINDVNILLLLFWSRRCVALMLIK